MATYKAKLQRGRTTYKGYHFSWRKCTQDQLAFAYEELGLKQFVEKTTNNGTNKKSKKKSKKQTNIKIG